MFFIPGRHLGREKLANQIKEKYYFMGMTNMINSYIDSCAYCQVHRPSSRAPSVVSSEGSVSAFSSDTEDLDISVNSSINSSAVEESTPNKEVKVECPGKLCEAHHFWEIVSWFNNFNLGNIIWSIDGW